MSELEMVSTYREVAFQGACFVGRARVDGSVHCFEFPDPASARRFDTSQRPVAFARFTRPLGRQDPWHRGLEWARWRTHGLRAPRR